MVIPKDPLNNIPALVHIMNRRTGKKPLSEPVVIILLGLDYFSLLYTIADFKFVVNSQDILDLSNT